MLVIIVFAVPLFSLASRDFLANSPSELCAAKGEESVRILKQITKSLGKVEIRFTERIVAW